MKYTSKNLDEVIQYLIYTCDYLGHSGKVNKSFNIPEMRDALTDLSTTIEKLKLIKDKIQRSEKAKKLSEEK